MFEKAFSKLFYQPVIFSPAFLWHHWLNQEIADEMES